MSLLKDYHDQHLIMVKKYWWKQLINPSNLYHTIQQRHQRAERGYSDRDVWNTGGHILDVVSGMLKQLGDEKSHIDWTEYFSQNYKTHGYTSLIEVSDDIKSFIEHDESSWADNLGFKLKIDWEDVDDGRRMIDKNSPQEKRLMKKAMRDWQKEWKRRQVKMKKAMNFVTDNIPGLWD